MNNIYKLQEAGQGPAPRLQDSAVPSGGHQTQVREEIMNLLSRFQSSFLSMYQTSPTKLISMDKLILKMLLF